MNDDSPNVGTSDDNNDDDVSRRSPAVLSFWGVQTFESKIPMLPLSNPLKMSTHRGSSCPITTAWGGGGDGIVDGGGSARSKRQRRI